jgi:hypothetical protein
MGQKPYAKERDEVLQSFLSGIGRYAEKGAVAGTDRPQTSDLSSKKMSPDGFSCIMLLLVYDPQIVFARGNGEKQKGVICRT